MTAFVADLLAIAFPGWRSLGRRSWCAKQQRRLRALDPRVVWVHDGKKMPWALWGADHGFFELEWAHRLPYLRAVAPVPEVEVNTPQHARRAWASPRPA